MLTLEQFNNIKSGTTFDTGLLIDSHEGLNMSGSKKMLRWVAVKGWADDWCIYAHLAHHDEEFVKLSGDKVMGDDNIMMAVPCDEDVLSRCRSYRMLEETETTYFLEKIFRILELYIEDYDSDTLDCLQDAIEDIYNKRTIRR